MSAVYLVEIGSEAARLATKCAQAIGVKSVIVTSISSFLDSYVREARGCLIVDATLSADSLFGFLSCIALRGNVHIPVIVLQATPTIPFVVEVMREGAASVIPYASLVEELPAQVSQLTSLDSIRFSKREAVFDAQDRLARLTREELRVLALLLDGYTNKDIAITLSRGLRTIEKRRHEIARKLPADSITAMMRLVNVSGIHPQRLASLTDNPDLLRVSRRLAISSSP